MKTLIYIETESVRKERNENEKNIGAEVE